MAKKNLTVQIDSELLEEYQKICKSKERSVSVSIRDFIRDEVKKAKK